MTRRVKTYIALSIIPQIFLVKYLGSYPELIEKYYSNGFYPFISKISRYVFGWIPFSVGDIFYTIAGILILRFFIINRKFLSITPKEFLKQIFVTISLTYFAFHVFWGMNYYRQPLHETIGVSDKFTVEDLYEVTERMIEKANEAHFAITKNDTVRIIMPYSKDKIFGMTRNGYEKIGKQWEQFNYYPISIKKSLYSTMLSYMGFSGYLNPFTNEAHVNGLIFNYKFPTTSCHEQAHQLGYSAENDANFIGYLAAINNDDIYFKYSGYIYGMRYCLGEIKAVDFERFEELSEKINPGIIKNYKEVSTFWQKYRTPVESAFKGSYNTFLKANNQKAGLKSYSYVVALLVNYYKDREF